jgi:hypothetical protein
LILLLDPPPSSRQARFSRPFEAGHVTLVLARLDLPAASATAAALTVAATVDAERAVEEAPGRSLLGELGGWRVCALQVELLPDYVALRPLETWCDFAPFAGFDFTPDSVLAPGAPDAAADDSMDDASSEPGEEPAPPPPPSKKTKTPKRG